MNRRDFMITGMASLGLASLPSFDALAAADEKDQTNVTLRITPVSLEIGPGKIIKTAGYNGSAPGPILRFREGKQVTVDVYNETDVAETVHWHGQMIPSAVDGSVEEGTPEIPAHGHRREHGNFPDPVELFQRRVPLAGEWGTRSPGQRRAFF